MCHRWTDQSADTWESVRDVADNLLRDFEAKWWTAVRKGDEATINEMMDGGGEVLSRTLNPDRRSALHFAAALGKAALVQRLIKSGAEVDLGDKEGCVVPVSYLCRTCVVSALTQFSFADSSFIGTHLYIWPLDTCTRAPSRF